MSAPKKSPALRQAKNSMLMEWTSQPSMLGQMVSMGTRSRFIQSAKAWPASWVTVSTSSRVPLKLAKMKGTS